MTNLEKSSRALVRGPGYPPGTSARDIDGRPVRDRSREEDFDDEAHEDEKDGER